MIPGFKKIISYYLIFGVVFSVLLTEKLFGESCSEVFSSIYKNEKSIYKGGWFSESFKGFRLNEINPILIQISDIFDTRYFDLLTGSKQSKYIWHNSGLTPEEADVFFSRVDDFLSEFVSEILYDRKWAWDTDVFLDPDISRYVVVTLIKIFNQTRGHSYIDLSGELVWTINRDSRSVPGDHNIFYDSPIVWKVTILQASKKLLSSIIMYYDLKFGGKRPHVSGSGLVIEKEIHSIDTLYYTKKELSQKRQRYDLRSKNIKNIEQAISAVKIPDHKEGPLIDRVYSGYFLNVIKSWSSYNFIIKVYPYLEEQDLGFIVKFLMNSKYRDEFFGYLRGELSDGEFQFVVNLTRQSKLSDLDQIFYIGPFSFSLKQILTVLYRNEELNLTPKEVVKALRNLMGEGSEKIDTSEVLSQIQESSKNEHSLPPDKVNLDKDSFLDFFYSIGREITGVEVVKLFVMSLTDKKNLNISGLSQGDVALVRMYLKNRGFVKLDKPAEYNKY